ncbi:MAG TPA: DUF4870 domain-containing protein [Ktedonobacteraceae bacterium]|nr:DUF4870 domain-containing protein [Ktedonobacteraceae bacterium]
MSWNPNQGQNPNQPGQYGSSAPPLLTDPSTPQSNGYQQPYSTPAPGLRPNVNGPTSMGMEANIAAGLSYIVGWITGLIFFLMEKQNRFVRFHAMQSILFSAALTAFYILLNIVSFALAIASIPFLGLLLSVVGFIVAIGTLIVWIFLVINAFQGKYFKLPVLGNYAERYANPKA